MHRRGGTRTDDRRHRHRLRRMRDAAHQRLRRLRRHRGSCGRTDDEALVIDVAEVPVLRLLSTAGSRPWAASAPAFIRRLASAGATVGGSPVHRHRRCRGDAAGPLGRPRGRRGRHRRWPLHRHRIAADQQGCRACRGLRWPPVTDVRAVDELRASGWPPGSTPSAWPRPSRSTWHRATTSRRARRPGCTAACTSPTATRRGPPTRAARSPGARALVVGARSYRRDGTAEPRRPSGRPRRGSPATPGTTTTRPCATASTRSPAACGPTAGAAVVLADDNAPGRPGGGLPGRPRLVRQERQPAAARARLVVRARLGGHRRAAAADAERRCADGCGPCRRCLDGCPTGAIVAPGRRRRPPLPGLAGAGAGRVPARATATRSATASTAATTARRCARPTALADRGTGRRRRRRATLEAWVPLLELLAPTDDELLARHGRWYIPGREPRWLRRNALVVLGNIGDGDDPAVGAALRALPRPAPTRCCASMRRGRPAHARPPRPARAGARRHRERTCSSPTTSRPRSAGSSRTCGSCGAGCRPTSSRCSPRRTRAPPRSTPRSRSASCARREPVLLPDARACAGRIDALADEVGAELVVLDPALPLGLVGPRARATPTPSWCTAPRSPCPGRLPGTRPLLGRVLRGAAPRDRGRRLPAAEAERAAGRDAADDGRAARRRRRALPPARRPSAARPRRERFGLPVDGRSSSASAGSCPARASTC